MKGYSFLILAIVLATVTPIRAETKKGPLDTFMNAVKMDRTNARELNVFCDLFNCAKHDCPTPVPEPCPEVKCEFPEVKWFSDTCLLNPCGDHGKDFTTLENGGFECTCHNAWDGKQCKEDRDECAIDNFCGHGNCTNYDMTNSTEKEWEDGSGFNCTCEDDWRKDDDGICSESIDSCEHSGDAFCDEKQMNCRDLNEGGYACVCPKGQSLKFNTNTTTCGNTDECENNDNHCGDGYHCVDLTDIDEDTEKGYFCTKKHNCSDHIDEEEVPSDWYDTEKPRINCKHCSKGWYGSKCQFAACGTQEYECGPHGECDEDADECKCKTGWTSENDDEYEAGRRKVMCTKKRNICEHITNPCGVDEYCVPVDGSKGYKCLEYEVRDCTKREIVNNCIKTKDDTYEDYSKCTVTLKTGYEKDEFNCNKAQRISMITSV